MWVRKLEQFTTTTKLYCISIYPEKQKKKKKKMKSKCNKKKT